MLSTNSWVWYSFIGWTILTTIEMKAPTSKKDLLNDSPLGDDKIDVNKDDEDNDGDFSVSYDDVYSTKMISELDTNSMDVRTIGVIQSADHSTNEDIREIMSMLLHTNVTSSKVTLTDYDAGDAYEFRKVIRNLRAVNPDAVIGPYTWPYAVATEHLRIPYFVLTQVPLEQQVSPFLIQMFPDARVFSKATEDLMEYYSLTKAMIFHDSDAGQIILEQLSHQSWMDVTGFFVDAKSISSLRDQLKMVRSRHYTTFISVLNANNTRYLLDEGLSLSMLSPPNNWVLINMDLDDFLLEKYVDTYANITVLSIMADASLDSCSLEVGNINAKKAIAHDALRVHAFMRRDHLMMLRNASSGNMSDITGKLEIDGCTGHLQFHPNSTRTETFLKITTLDSYTTGATGTWRSRPRSLKNRVNPWKSFSGVTQGSRNVFGDQPLRITVKLEQPFIHKKAERGFDTGHPDYEGFLIDILLEMEKLLGFKYKITEVADDKFGSLKPHGWTGMVREILDNKADLALAHFQMSTERALVVDFTKPFMTKGTTVVVRRPETTVGMFQFLSPFSFIVWCAIFIAFIATSLMLFAVSRVNSDKQAKYTHNLRESFWYMWGTLLRGSLTGSPHAISSRIISSAWWFFCLILSSIYTANLAAFLTITIGDIGINTAQDLANQDRFEYGTVEGSQTQTFFNHTRMTHYEKMWAHMSVSPAAISKNTEVAFKRVREGNYAFIWDSPLIRHEISNDCNLMEIGSPFDLKGYGFAYRKNALFGERLSWAILRLQDDGVLYRLERKWWRPQFCPSQQQSATTESLELETVAGMYVVIITGAAISALMCLLQYCYSQLRRKRKLCNGKKKCRQHTSNADDLDHDYKFQSSLEMSPVREDSWDRGQEAITYANHSPIQYVPASDWT